MTPRSMKGSNTKFPRDVGESSPTPDIRAFQRASLWGGLLAVAGFVALISRGFTSFTATSFGSNFYDVQARSMAHGHFDVPANVAKIEGLLVQGKTYLYFGPFLSVLRMPMVLLFPGTSGHLTQASMTIGFCLLLGAVSWMSWMARQLVRDASPLTRKSLFGQACFVLVAGLGSVAFYLACSPTVYYETELWGAALSAWCLVSFLRFTQTRSTKWLLLQGMFTLFVALTRTSIAMGMIALLLATTLLAARDFRRSKRRGPVAGNAPDLRSRLVIGVCSLVVIVVSLVSVNIAKFGTMFSIPFASQFAVRAHFPPSLADFFAQHHRVLGIRYLPTTVYWYLSPASFHVSPLFPFFDFTRSIRVIGGVQFAWLQPSSSVTSTMPLLFLLSVVGLVGLSRRHVLQTLEAPRSLLTGFRLATLAAIISALGTLLFTGIANRYMADFLPLLFLGGALGFHLAGRWIDGLRRPWMVTIATLGALLGAWSFYANASLGVLEAYSLKTNVQGDSGAGFLSFQISASHALTGNKAIPYASGSTAPLQPQYGELYVQNHCAALYSYQFAGWGPVEVGRQGGQFNLAVTMPTTPPRGVEPLLVSGATPDRYEWWGIRFLSGNRFVLRWTSVIPNGPTPPGPPMESTPQPYVPGASIPMQLSIAITGPSEATVAVAQVRQHEVLRMALFWVHTSAPNAPVWTLGRFPTGDRTSYAGSIQQLPVSTPLCSRLLAQQ